VSISVTNAETFAQKSASHSNINDFPDFMAHRSVPLDMGLDSLGVWVMAQTTAQNL
jgi:hypothetical protein